MKRNIGAYRDLGKFPHLAKNWQLAGHCYTRIFESAGGTGRLQQNLSATNKGSSSVFTCQFFACPSPSIQLTNSILNLSKFLLTMGLFVSSNRML